jgi:putative methylase
MTNPPFGTKPDKAGMDAEFLKLACRLATRAVYSFHKTSTRSYIVSLAKSLPKVENVTVVAEMKFDIPQTYKFHKKASVDVLVDLIRVQLKNESSHLKSDH